jgi:CheY-like chemotaxis protein
MSGRGSDVPTLLVADDSVAVQRFIELTFANQGVSVVTAGNGDEAVRLIDANSPDIVLADIEMPGASGYDVADHVRRSSTLSHVPVLLMASAFDPVEETRAARVGAAGVLTKPLEPEALVKQVKELVARPRTAPALAIPAGPEDLAPRTATTAALDDYFAQLDRAIASRVAAVQQAPALPEPALAAADEETAVSGQPSLASAFSAILDAEQSGAEEPSLAEWMPPAAPSGVVTPPPAITEELIERITERVLARLSDRVVRDSVTTVVSDAAERLIAQEIERIKSNIK